jgi:hypothetical protein
VFQLVKCLGHRSSSPPASLEGTDPNIWVKHFHELLGKAKPPNITASSIMQETATWKLCADRLTNSMLHYPEWDIPLDAPDFSEVLSAAKSAHRNKACAAIIPTELFIHSNFACRILTELIIRIWNGSNIPNKWLNAVLCLLYKNKGSRTDPNSFRGISLLTSAEKILSIIILKRIKEPLEKHLLHQQSGFRSSKSCSNATFVLTRFLEEAIRLQRPRIFTFVDFSKAFDSLDWSTMWKVLRAQGMPSRIVDLIHKLYTGSTISVRLSMEGAFASAFDQQIGIRQGCSLSPALFVLVLDFALRSFETCCAQNEIATEWLGYADDLVLISSSESAAQQALHQLQAACAFVGLFINISKTECMAVQTKPAEILISNATKERITVKWDHAWYEGWLVDWSGRSLVLDDQILTALDLSRFTCPPTHILMYDDGDYTPVLVKKSGWLMDSDGDNHRFKHLGFQEFLNASRNSFRCPDCSEVFGSARALTTHTHSRWCRKLENLSTHQASQLRRSRRASQKRMGISQKAVEPVRIVDIDGHCIQSVGEFKYLGTLINNRGETTAEIIRRIQIASLAFSHLKTIWNSSHLSMVLKMRLFSVMVASVLMYNSECWTVTANDTRLLEGFYFRCLRYLTRSIRHAVQSVPDKPSKADVFRVANVPWMSSLLRERRLRWLGHLIRSDPNDTARQQLLREVSSNSSWWKSLLSDLRAIKVNGFQHAVQLAADRATWRALSSARSGLSALYR